VTELPDSANGLVFAISEVHICTVRCTACTTHDTNRPQSGVARPASLLACDAVSFGRRSLCLNLQAQINSFFKETQATRTFVTLGTSHPATCLHSSPQQNYCTNCSHIAIPLSRANFQQIQRVTWQSAHCMLLKYRACSVNTERTAEMCRNDLLIAFAL
jgi:hypothetical protein